MSSTGIKQIEADFGVFYNNVTCLSNLNVSGSINTNDYKFNDTSLFSYLPYSYLSASGAFSTISIDADTFCYVFTGTGQIQIPNAYYVDIILVGAGGRGGIGSYSGGGGAGEVLYYPQYPINSGTYDITIGIDSAITANRTSAIKKAGINQLVALGGGNGAYWNSQYETTVRAFPPKAYNSVTARVSSSLGGRTCYKTTFSLDTTGITYGSGTYECYYSTIYATNVTIYEAYLLFNYETTSTVNRYVSVNNGYVVTTGNVNGLNASYFQDITYKGDWIAIKLPLPVILTGYTLTQNSAYLDRAPALWRIYASMDGTTWTLIQSQTTGATYTSRVHTNTGLSANTTPYIYYTMVIK